jgi:putative transcriptional regulator
MSISENTLNIVLIFLAFLCTFFSVDFWRGFVLCFQVKNYIFSEKGGDSMLVFRFDVLQALKDKGVSTYMIRKDNLLGQKTLMDIKAGIVPGIKSINALCALLDCQPGDLIEYRPDR